MYGSSTVSSSRVRMITRTRKNITPRRSTATAVVRLFLSRIRRLRPAVVGLPKPSLVKVIIRFTSVYTRARARCTQIRFIVVCAYFRAAFGEYPSRINTLVLGCNGSGERTNKRKPIRRRYPNNARQCRHCGRIRKKSSVYRKKKKNNIYLCIIYLYCNIIPVGFANVRYARMYANLRFSFLFFI